MVVINLIVELGYTSFEPIYRGIILMALIVATTLLFATISRRCVETPVSVWMERKIKHG